MHSNLYVIIGAAILPAIAWVVFIWWKDKYQREPISYILRGVAYGIISAGLAVALESLIIALGLVPEPHGYIGALWKAFMGAAVPEELVKLLMLWLLLRNNPYFDERFDGIVYACCIGMGFAGTENIIYLIDNMDTWESVAIGRALFAVPGHFLFAVAMGYFYSMIHFGDMSWRKANRIFIVPVLLHGIYDSLIFMSSLDTMWSGILLVCFYIFCLKMLRYGRRRIAEQLKRDRHQATIIQMNEETTI